MNPAKGPSTSLNRKGGFCLVARVLAGMIMLVGFLMLARVIHDVYTGELALKIFGSGKDSRMTVLYALGLGLPVPLHVISIGLILQKRWLSLSWSRVAWFAIVTSGCWLGIALSVKIAFL